MRQSGERRAHGERRQFDNGEAGIGRRGPVGPGFITTGLIEEVNPSIGLVPPRGQQPPGRQSTETTEAGQAARTGPAEPASHSPGIGGIVGLAGLVGPFVGRVGPTPAPLRDIRSEHDAELLGQRTGTVLVRPGRLNLRLSVLHSGRIAEYAFALLADFLNYRREASIRRTEPDLIRRCATGLQAGGLFVS